MEERLEHLEASCTSMATELLEKTELVQHYVGKTRTGKKVFNFDYIILQYNPNCLVRFTLNYIHT